MSCDKVKLCAKVTLFFKNSTAVCSFGGITHDSQVPGVVGSLTLQQKHN